METVNILGINDEVTVCECCGKSDLKCTVVLDFDGEIAHYGRNCAAKALSANGRKSTIVTVERDARAESRRQQEFARIGAELTRLESQIAAGETVNRWGVSLTLLADQNRRMIAGGAR